MTTDPARAAAEEIVERIVDQPTNNHYAFTCS
jgi:hypothetical protein